MSVMINKEHTVSKLNILQSKVPHFCGRGNLRAQGVQKMINVRNFSFWFLL